MMRTALFVGLVGLAVACANACADAALGQGPNGPATHGRDGQATNWQATGAGEGEFGEFKAVPPSIGVAQGGALVGLARSAMAQYIKSRTPADQQALGPEVSGLAGSPLCAAVTLRQDGAVVGRSIKTGPSLTGNVISAALEAMRSPDLPDRVTAAFLDSCTLELEVLGPPLALANGPEPLPPGPNQSKYQKELAEFQKQSAQFNARLGGAINPGLTGLLLVRGDRRPDGRPNGRAYILPSDAYEHSLGPADMVPNCRIELAGDADGPSQWSIFLTMHFVGYPDGRIVCLSRGKRMAPPETIDEKMLRDGAASIGNFLVRHQVRAGDKDAGLYVGAYIIDGALPSVVDQAHAAYAMSLLAKKTGGQEFAASAKAADEYLLKFVKREEDVNGHAAAWLAWHGGADQEQIAATAWWSMAAAASENMLPVASIEFLSRSLPSSSSATRATGESRPATSPANDGYRGGESVFIGFYAIKARGVVRADSPEMRARLAEIEPVDLRSALWKARAGFSSKPAAQIVAEFSGKILGEDGPLDEVGGVRPKGGYPLTELTALLAMAELENADATGAGRARDGVGRTLTSGQTAAQGQEPAHPTSGEAAALAARRFCYQMTYRPTEAYFWDRPHELVGGVRGSPVSAEIRLSACAAAIEAEIGGRP